MEKEGERMQVKAARHTNSKILRKEKLIKTILFFCVQLNAASLLSDYSVYVDASWFLCLL